MGLVHWMAHGLRGALPNNIYGPLCICPPAHHPLLTTTCT
jgi:hypothetical protein